MAIIASGAAGQAAHSLDARPPVSPAAVGRWIAIVLFLAAFGIIGAGLGAWAALVPQLRPDATLIERIGHVLVQRPHPIISFGSILFAFIMAVAYLSTRGGRTLKRARVWRIIKLALSPKYLGHRSTKFDLLYYVLNAKVFAVALAFGILSLKGITHLTHDTLISLFGKLTLTTWPKWAVILVGSFVLYLVYELAYYIDHYTSHKIPFFWEFHRVHHEAEHLSPLTVYRIHPLETLKFANISALFLGVGNGALNWAFGLKLGMGTYFSEALFVFALMYLFLQLHHTHIWIAFTGVLGRIVLSPAHHQIHHSADPRHFDKNMGSALAVFDWLFGTLYVPSKKREKLTFGVKPHPSEGAHDPHTLKGAVLTPFVRGAQHITAAVEPRGQAVEPSTLPRS
jgi:sterol desaturase/sphingolipid hydroxylase (fatty acid hydroxylase superfamily)